MKLLRHNKIWPVLVAGLLVLAVSVAPAMAYFTTYVTAKGGYTLSLQEEVTVTEEYKDFVKHITVHNGGESESFVRVKVFCGSSYALAITGNGWTVGDDGYLYYDSVVAPEADTAELMVQIQNVPAEAVGSFNVIVTEESTAALYTVEGSPYADWTAVYAGSTGDYEMEVQQ